MPDNAVRLRYRVRRWFDGERAYWVIQGYDRIAKCWSDKLGDNVQYDNKPEALRECDGLNMRLNKSLICF